MYTSYRLMSNHSRDGKKLLDTFDRYGDAVDRMMKLAKPLHELYGQVIASPNKIEYRGIKYNVTLYIEIWKGG